MVYLMVLAATILLELIQMEILSTTALRQVALATQMDKQQMKHVVLAKEASRVRVRPFQAVHLKLKEHSRIQIDVQVHLSTSTLQRMMAQDVIFNVFISIYFVQL